jgi:CelD/BcsL family acetyltransferase involved in cellulose biosynthesis
MTGLEALGPSTLVAQSPPSLRPPRSERSLQLLPQSHTAWSELLERSEDRTPFHHPAWSSLLSECYGYRSFAAVLMEGSHALAGMPLIELRSLLGQRRWVSLPFTDECRPLGATAADGAELLTRLASTRVDSGLSSIEIRAEVDSPSAWRQVAGFSHVLDLDPDPEVVRRKLHRSRVQLSLATAESGPLRVEWATEERDLVDVFYRLHVTTRRRQGVPVQPRRFFRLLWSNLIHPGLGRLSIAYAGKTPVAGALYLAWGNTVVYKFAASDRAHWSLCPNHLVLWEGIRWGCENGFQRFDFGRTDLENEGLRAFKGGWGTREELLRYSLAADAAPSPQRSRLARATGGVIKHSPAVVCRALGEAFYGHAG